MDTLEADGDRLIERILGANAFAEMIAARAVRQAGKDVPPVLPASSPGPPSTPVLRLTTADAEAAGGATSQAFNASLIERAVAACVPPGDPDAQAKARAITDALTRIGPKTAVEALLASLLVACHHAALDALASARKAKLDSQTGQIMLKDVLDRCTAGMTRAERSRQGREARMRMEAAQRGHRLATAE